MLTRTCSQVKEFLSLIDDLYRRIRFAPGKEIVLFRGQNIDKPLMPKHARSVTTMLEFDLMKTDA